MPYTVEYGVRDRRGSSSRGADAAWVFKGRIKGLDPKAFSRFWPAAPNFVIESRLPTGRIRALREKMDEWLAAGAQLRWLIDPETRTVEVYGPGLEAEAMTGAPSVRGEGPMEGFEVDLAPVWDPLAG